MTLDALIHLSPGKHDEYWRSIDPITDRWMAMKDRAHSMIQKGGSVEAATAMIAVADERRREELVEAKKNLAERWGVTE